MSNDDLLFNMGVSAGSIISNGSEVDFECDSLSGWLSADTGNGVTSQVTYDSRSTFKLAGGATYISNNGASVYKTLTAYAGDRVTYTLCVDPILLAPQSTGDTSGSFFFYFFYNSSHCVYLVLYSDAIYIVNDATGLTKVADLADTQGATHKITIDVTGANTPATAVADIYFDDSLVGPATDIAYALAYVRGAIQLVQYSRISASYTEKLTYVDRILIGDGLA